MNDAICLSCGYRDDMNSFILNAMDECDSPTITCPKCGGVGETIDTPIMTTTATTTTPEPEEFKDVPTIKITT